MQNKLVPFLALSLALHIGLAAYFQGKKKGAPPPPKPNKAIVTTVYLKQEVAPKVIPKAQVAKVTRPVPKKKSPPVAKKTAPQSPAKKTVPAVAKVEKKADTKAAPAISQAYAEEIAMQLKLLLSLPEYGAVKVGLVLSPTGEVTKVEILDSQSAINEKYLLSTLPKVKLPAPPNGETPLKLTLSNA